MFFELPPTTAAQARAMFKVSDDAKLRVRDPLHKQFGGSKVKALEGRAGQGPSKKARGWGLGRPATGADPVAPPPFGA